MTKPTRRGRAPSPRMRDLPAPRENPSAAGPLVGRIFAWPYRAALAGLHRTGVRGLHLTLVSVGVNVVVGLLLLTGRRLVPGLLLLAAGLLDVFDGGIARLRGEASRIGALLDSSMDRIADGVVLGSLFVSLHMQGDLLGAGLALSALVISLLVSHLRAEAEALGARLSEGTFQRLERYLALVIGLTVPGALLPALALLTALGAWTVIQRLVGGWRRLG